MSKAEDPPDYVCPVFATHGKCGEQDALRVMEQFKNFYESKLSEIDVQGGGDSLETKLKIQRRWIDDLTEQTQMMARIVKELEDEATTRVRMLEDKLRQTSKSAYEVMKRYQSYSITHNLDEPFQKLFYLENDVKNLLEFIRRARDDRKWSIDGLQFYELSYKDLFGKEQKCDCSDKDTIMLPIPSNGLNSNNKETSPKLDKHEVSESFEGQLKRKTEEYENMKQSMLDMRSALTEEVACKHDMISALKKDVQQLEERCVQADKQTAFKDDIIKELRKEIKQLKKQNKEKEANLEEQLQKAKQQIQQMKPCVDVRTAHTMMDDELVIKKSKLIQNKDEIIQIQNNTLNVIQTDLQDTKKKEKELEEEICRRQGEVEELKCKCAELEKSLKNSQGRADNLQKAVDLYSNSVNVLEASEERARIEIEQQRTTIANLQEALVNVKQELDEFRQNGQQEVQHQQYLGHVLYVNVLDLEEKNEVLSNKMSLLNNSYKKLQDCNFDLEVEHFNSLQDLSVLETQLCKYQTEFRSFEDIKGAARAEIKKLRQQNRYYEHTVECFKNEMAVMSEQLSNLQEILNLSNQSCREENGQLYASLVELQKVCEKLHNDLINTEKKVLVENQMNQMKDAKIGQLQLIIGQKNADLNVHDDAINDMTTRLEHAVIENHELQQTIVALNSTVMQLKCNMKQSEVDNCRSPKSCIAKRSVTDFKDDLEKKTRTLEVLQAEYKYQHQLVKQMQSEMDKVKEKSKEKNKQLRRQNEDLKDKLASSELHNQHLVQELSQIKNQTSILAEKECCREQDLAQSKQTILELRQTLIELNESFTQSELQQSALVEEFQKKKIKENREQEDIYLSCRCEIALYKKLAENLKQGLIESKRNLANLEDQNRVLREELHHAEARILDIQKIATRKEKDACQCVNELNEKLKESQVEEKRLREFMENLKKEVHTKIQQQHEKAVSNKNINHKAGLCECCDCTDMNSTQEEISGLKVELKNMIQNQLALNSENDKLLKQVTGLQNAVSSLEEKNRNLKQKLDKLHGENQNLKEKNKTLTRENEMHKQTVKNLEIELTDIRANRDDVCAESKCVMNNVKGWLEEQRKINEKVKKKTQCYCDTIKKLRNENDHILQSRPMSASPGGGYKPRNNRNSRGYTSPPPRPVSPPIQLPHNPWCLGSQGTGSMSPADSPSSFLTCSVDEWYSPNYRDEDETTDDDLVNRLEAITHRMKKNNKKWKPKCTASKDQ